MNFVIEEEGTVGVLTVEGDVTIMRANELKTALMNSLDKVNHVLLNFEKATAVDLTCLQLLYSAHMTSSRMNKCLTFEGCSEHFKRTMADAGISNANGCIFVCENKCLSGKEGHTEIPSQ